jgi:hypothetical protein
MTMNRASLFLIFHAVLVHFFRLPLVELNDPALAEMLLSMLKDVLFYLPFFTKPV